MHVESESRLMESHRKATVAVGCTFCLDEVAQCLNGPILVQLTLIHTLQTLQQHINQGQGNFI